MGRGKRVLMIQFIKGPWKSGEDEFGERFKIPKDVFEIRKMGKGFVGILGDKLPREEHEQAAREALHMFQAELAAGKWNVFILDEINVALSLKLIRTEEVLSAVAVIIALDCP